MLFGAGCRALLRRMAPEHKFATAARLCSEVLSGFAEGTLPLDSAAEVLRDALNILASKDIKVHPGPTSSCPLMSPAACLCPCWGEGAVIAPFLFPVCKWKTWGVFPVRSPGTGNRAI